MILPGNDNAFSIIDKVKKCLKLHQGEYVAPEKIEHKLFKCKYIELIFIYGHSLQSYLFGIFIKKSWDVIEFLKSKGIENIIKENYKDYYENPDLIKDIPKKNNDYNRKNDIKGFEIVKNAHLCKELFSVDNNLLTTIMKIRKHIAKKLFSKIL